MRFANMDRILMPQKMNSLLLPFGNTCVLKTLAVRKTRSSLLCAITNAPQVIMPVLLWVPLQPALLSSSCCPEILWHEPISKTKAQVSGTGYVTDDGHYFSCDHSKNMVNHVIFVIDRSSSMRTADCRPTLMKFSRKHPNRLGSVYDAIVRFIRTRLASGLKDSMSVVLFNTTATTAFECQDMAENLTDQLLYYHPFGGTTYSCHLPE
jgi:hypothetical protein